MPKLHPLASVYIYERMNDEGLVAVANSPYPLIPKVFPMRRAIDVHQALAGEDYDDAYVFAVARSYMAEKFLKRKYPAAVHASVLAVERKIHPSHLQAFHDARVYFGLPRSFLYRDRMSETAMVAGVAVNRLSYDDPDGPPAYSPEPPLVQVVTRGQHCCTCTCGSHDAPPYQESPSNTPSPSASSTSLFRPLSNSRRLSLPLPARGRSHSDARVYPYNRPGRDARVVPPSRITSNPPLVTPTARMRL